MSAHHPMSSTTDYTTMAADSSCPPAVRSASIATLSEAQRLPNPLGIHNLTPVLSQTLGVLEDVHGKVSDELPIYWSPRPSEIQDGGPKRTVRMFLAEVFRGWRLIVLGSWLNILLLLIPVTWILKIRTPDAHGLIFFFCILAMLPVVNLHDIAIRDLINRIGGSKAALLNASMSNVVTTVVAISALRKCELRVVQSSLIGSMLSKILLVLGLCFFAGGMRFTEQGFDVTATRIHSSLLSISVGAVLLPAAYHFVLSGTSSSGATPLSQQHNILRMSHCVSLVLLFIYAAYLLFQLWSHTHLYKDTQQQSHKLVVRVPDTPRIFRGTKKMKSPCIDGLQKGEVQQFDFPSPSPSPSPSTSFQPEKPVPFYASITTNSGPCSPEQPLATGICSHADLSNEGPTLRLVHGPNGVPVQPLGSQDSFSVSTRCPSPTLLSISKRASSLPNSEDPYSTGSPPPSPSETPPLQLPKKEPRIGWPVTILSMVNLTICVSVLADWLVASMDGISHAIGKEWVSLILLPTVNALAECSTAVTITVKDQMTLTIGVTIGSTIQTALFVIPFMVTLAWTMGHPLSLLMDPFESLALYISVQTMSYVVAGGKSNWLEGLILICLYMIIAVSFWFYPASDLPSALAIC